MKNPIYKHWREWIEDDAFVTVEKLDEKLNILATYNDKFDQCIAKPKSLDSSSNYILEPNVSIVKEYNTSFIELMQNHSHQYQTARIVPIQIIRSLIDVGAAFKAYIDSPDKKRYAEEYHKGCQFDRIDKKRITYYVRKLNTSYDFVLELYQHCCNYVHTNYLQAKAQSIWHISTKPGKNGFMGAYYKVKYEDFENELIEGILDGASIPFDYEEELDITSYCIKVNDMLLDLVEEVKQNDYDITNDILD